MFPEASEMDFTALIFMMAVYGYILMTASQTISAGSEMLLLLYGPGIIGGLVIPILGAIPDCAIILISGMGDGPKEEIQKELSVGVGTLVGSTVMLLTLPWAAGIFLGRRDYDTNTKSAKQAQKYSDRVTSFSLVNNCVEVVEAIPQTAIIMMASSASYLIIQIPSFFFKNTADNGASEEAPYALAGVFITFVAFCVYCYSQITSATNDEITKMKQKQLKKEEWKRGLDRKFNDRDIQLALFKKHDKDKSGYITQDEFVNLMNELGFVGDRKEVLELFREIDVGHGTQAEGKSDGKITEAEFSQAFKKWLDNPHMGTAGANKSGDEQKQVLLEKKDSEKGKHDTEGEGEDEEEEEEENHWDKSDFQLKLHAVFLLLIGTIVCTIFSDPMVDVIGQVGLRLNISPFYVSFVVTPLASNASEVIAGLIFAKKKTKDSISLTLGTLHGAATMNSTLSLCIFMCLIYFRELSWSFSAEVITVMFVIIVVGLNSLSKIIYLWQAVVVGSLYPFSILMVYVMENCFGLD